MTVHHIGYAVRDIERAKGGFLALGYKEEGEPVLDRGRNVAILFMGNGPLRVELVGTADPSRPSPVEGWLRDRGGAEPYHICYEVPDLEGEIERLRGEGFILAEVPAPAPAIDGRRVAFLYRRPVGLVELVER